ncbi:MAG: hypothetical protein RSD53_02250, partial [Algoriella sp.]
QSIKNSDKFIGFNAELIENNLTNSLGFHKAIYKEGSIEYYYKYKDVNKDVEELIYLTKDDNNILTGVKYIPSNPSLLINYIESLKDNGFIQVSKEDLNYDKDLNPDIFILFINKDNIVVRIDGKISGVHVANIYKYKK